MVFITAAMWPTGLRARPPSAEVTARRKAEVEQIQKSLEKYATSSEKIQHLEKELARNKDTYVREKIVDLAATVGGDELEPMLIRLVQDDPQVRVCIAAVKKLAQHGSALSIPVLLDCARQNPTGRFQRDPMVSAWIAPRNAYFALAEIGLRVPKERQRIAAAVRKLPVVHDQLADVKIQTLYMLTENENLLAPFFERLDSPDPEIRQDGVVAFRFLKLRSAPKELTVLIHDDSEKVRRWVALVLGEIGDPQTVPLLIEVARDDKMDRNTRCNAIGSLGKMRAKDAEAVLRELLADGDVQVNAAISLSQITGKRHPLVPKGYGLDLDSETPAQSDAPVDADSQRR